MRNRITKLLALAATATTMSLGATATWATFVDVTAIKGCALALPDASTITPALVAACAGNEFANANASGSGTFAYSSSATPAGLTVSTSFQTVGGLDQILITFTNTNNTNTSLGDTVWVFSNLQAALGDQLTDIVDRSIVTHNGNTQAPGVTSSPALSVAFDGLTIDPDGNWFVLDWNGNAGTPRKGAAGGDGTVVITGTLVKAPEPGTVALLGALLIAFGVIRIGRVRDLASRVGKLVMS